MISYNSADNLKPIGISYHIRVFMWRFVTSHDECQIIILILLRWCCVSIMKAYRSEDDLWLYCFKLEKYFNYFMFVLIIHNIQCITMYKVI